MENKKNVISVLSKLMERDNSLTRCCAVRALERLDARDDKIKKQLIDLLLDEDPDVRMDAAGVLGRQRHEDAVGPLIKNLEGDPDGEVRIEVVKALSRIKSEKSVEPLIECFKAEGYPELEGEAIDDLEFEHSLGVHTQTLDALGEIGDERATEPVINFLENEEFEDLQESGFQVLVRLNNDKAVEFLLRQLKHGGRLVRRRAAQVLASLPEFKGEGAEPRPEILNALTAALMDKEPAVRIAAAHVLGGVDNPLVVVPLTMLLSDPDLETRKEVATILGRMGGQELIERLHPMLDESDPFMKRRVAHILGEIADPSSQQPLSAMLDIDDEDVVYEIVMALGKIGVPGPELKIAEMLANQKGDPNLRIQAAQALGRILKNLGPDDDGEDVPEAQDEDGEDAVAEPDPKEILLASVFDKDERISYVAVMSLVELDPENSVEMLINLLTGKGLNGVESTIGEENEAAGESPVDELVQELDDKFEIDDPETSTLASIIVASKEKEAMDEDMDMEMAPPPKKKPFEKNPEHATRLLAARLLGHAGASGVGAVDALIAVTEEGKDDLCKAAIKSLSQIGDGKALPIIIQALESDNQDIRSVALEALGGFDDVSNADDRLIKMFDDPDPYIRQRIVEILGAGKGSKADEIVVKALDDESIIVCRTALGLLNKETIKEGSSEKIMPLAFKFSGDLRKDAGAALRRVGDYSETEKLLETLDDMDREEFHWMCIDVLAEQYAAEPSSKSIGGA